MEFMGILFLTVCSTTLGLALPISSPASQESSVDFASDVSSREERESDVLPTEKISLLMLIEPEEPTDSALDRLMIFIPDFEIAPDAPIEDLEKRSAEGKDDDDLETAAGTNVLRPLFVYRQQVAYRQRLRNGLSRGNRF
ncbi:uncharacterized protein LOC111673949 [Orussus abietinus]|uniref:uncharacterized protein LOC111673949 n=1 Tax=Orussus abietinus TaxID=222816 RepID=UPI000C71605E|nr:uncharacterized protein LOC111673949 [Orussus abietinus]